MEIVLRVCETSKWKACIKSYLNELRSELPGMKGGEEVEVFGT